MILTKDEIAQYEILLRNGKLADVHIVALFVTVAALRTMLEHVVLCHGCGGCCYPNEGCNDVREFAGRGL